MKFIFAPDSFKGSLTALEMTNILERTAKHYFPKAQTVMVPVADGGEGTVDALVGAAQGDIKSVTVTGPAGNAVHARYGLTDNGATAILEMAQASGLPLMEGKLDPLAATSKGTGEMIACVLDQGVQHIIIGIGGSATNDGGMGLLSALGAKFFDADGKQLYGCGRDLGCVETADFSGLNSKLKHVKITVICDVKNPLLGIHGATAVYGPQKGVTPELYGILEEGMSHYSTVVEKVIHRDIAGFPGSGAAGGVGAALGGVLLAQMRPGIEAVLELIHFDSLLCDAALVITGEGRIDHQSVAYGKVISGVAKQASAKGVPVIAIAGGMCPGAEALYELADSSIMTTVNGIMTLENAIQNAKELYENAADRTFRMLKIGMQMAERANVK